VISTSSSRTMALRTVSRSSPETVTFRYFSPLCRRRPCRYLEGLRKKRRLSSPRSSRVLSYWLTVCVFRIVNFDSDLAISPPQSVGVEAAHDRGGQSSNPATRTPPH